MSTLIVLLALYTWVRRRGADPTRLECLRRLVAAPEPAIKPIARGR